LRSCSWPLSADAARPTEPCYPLAVFALLLVPTDFRGDECAALEAESVPKQLARYLAWLYGLDTADDSSGVAPLHRALARESMAFMGRECELDEAHLAHELTREALYQLTCDGRSLLRPDDTSAEVATGSILLITFSSVLGALATVLLFSLALCTRHRRNMSRRAASLRASRDRAHMDLQLVTHRIKAGLRVSFDAVPSAEAPSLSMPPGPPSGSSGCTLADRGHSVGGLVAGLRRKTRVDSLHAEGALSLPEIPLELLQLVARAVPVDDAFAFGSVCTRFRRVMCQRGSQHARFPCGVRTRHAAAWASAARLAWARQSGYKWRASDVALCAEQGRFEVLQWAWEQGCPADERTCSAAARGGHLSVLQFARQQGCRWDSRTCSAAAAGGRLEVLQWARQQGCPWDADTCSEAAAAGRLEVLQWARQHGAPWNALVCMMAAGGGHLSVLRWARDNGCHWTELTCTAAAAGGHLQTLKWLRENGCPWDRRVPFLDEQASTILSFPTLPRLRVG